MEVTGTRENNYITLKVNRGEDVNVSYKISYHHPSGNCKLISLDGVGSFIGRVLTNVDDSMSSAFNKNYTEKEKKQIIKEFLSACQYKQIFVHLSSKKYAETLLKYVDTFYVSRTPVGYGSTPEDDNFYQYHICIKNTKDYDHQVEEYAYNFHSLVNVAKKKFPKATATMRFIMDNAMI